MKKNLYFAILLLIPSLMMAQKTSTLSKSNVAARLRSYWSLTGNSNINDTFNFLGTTDQHRLLFKVNGSQSGLIDFDLFQSNTTFGYQTLTALSQYGFNNTAFGYQALYKNTDGRVNLAMGVKAMYNNTTGYDNLAVGNASLFSNDVGIENTGLGHGTLNLNSSGSNNVAVGWNASSHNQTGSDNTAVGYNSLYFNNASENTAVGYYSSYNNSFGTFNTTSGYLSSFYNTVGNNNTSTGAYALYNNNSGSYNTAYGNQALLTNQDGNRNTALGARADVTDASFRNSTAIGYGAKVDASFKVQIGNMFVKSIGGAVGWTNYSDERIKQDVKENVPGLIFINQLKPVTYHFNTAKEAELLGKKDSLNEASESNLEKIQFTGFLAQDVDKAAKKTNYDFSGVDKSGKIMGLRYSEFVVPLVKAVQELSVKNDSLQLINANQQSQLETLQARLDKIEAMLNQSSTNAFAAQSSTTALITANTLFVYPNPAKNNLAIQFNATSQSAATITITDMKGNSAIQQSINAVIGNNNLNLNISGLAKGAYTFQLHTSHINLTKKFVKE